MVDFLITITMIGVVSWALIFMVTRRIFSKRSFEFSNRLVSTLHAIVSVSLASLSVQDWGCPLCPLASKSSPQQMKTLAFTLSYMIYDLICCQFDKRVVLDNVVHHLVTIVGIVSGLSYQRCGTEMVAALWITEISSPFLHLRELLKEFGYRDTCLNLAADREWWEGLVSLTRLYHLLIPSSSRQWHWAYSW
ncbi:PREDICTED: transmembrane protein 136-like isoform X2 [Tarenaya hassleriana]|uniref:transmembrane protein 136-like isoform X2 n=1 Tax=Tarenaya hassleriana TaxID=28532 RepID=UPI0008FD704A|nr:PREDICTED: transmembrane protein 136-like isoform X2 [Tarenaya hassleriana]